MKLTAANSIGQLAHALKPAGEPLSRLELCCCSLSCYSWHGRDASLLTAVNSLRCDSPTAYDSVQAVLRAGLQLMPGIRSVELSGCNLNRGLPAELCSLPAISTLRLDSCQLTDLPHLACQTGEWPAMLSALQRCARQSAAHTCKAAFLG